MKTCPFCKGRVDEKKIDHLYRWGKEFILFENVSVEACSQCGETFFAPDVLELMDKYFKERPKTAKMVSIPVVKLQETAVS